MRRIIIICSFGVIASGIENKVVERPDSIPMIDSLDLFRDITDISRQIERRTMQAKERIDSEIISPQQGTDTPPNPIITPPDTIIIPPVSNPVAKGTGSIIFEDSIPSFRNPLDSIYFRRENGTLQLPVNYNNVGSMNGLSFVP